MNQHSPLFDGSISLEYSGLLMQENISTTPLHAVNPPADSDSCLPPPHTHVEPCGPSEDGTCEPKGPKTDSDTCVPTPHTHPLREGGGPCIPSEDGSCEAEKEKYAGFAGVQSGWTFPAQPHA